MICPKCGYTRKPEDAAHVPEFECPACGVIYAKFTLAKAQAEALPVADVAVLATEKPAPVLVSVSRVVLVGVDLSINDLAMLIFKASIASIPAMIMLGGVAAVAVMVLSVIAAALK